MVLCLETAFMDKTKAKRKYTTEYKVREFGALCFLLLVLLVFRFLISLNQVFILSNLHKVLNFEIAFF